MTAPKGHIPPILGALLVAFAPNVLRLPSWIVAWCLICWGYCYLAALGKVPWLRRWIHQTLAIAGFIFGVISFEFALGRDTGIGLLSIMVGLKPLEIRSRRDEMMTLVLTYFVVIASLFYSNSLGMSLYMFLSVLVTTAVLIHINHSDGHPWAHLQLAAKIMSQALPLMALFFVLFPRIHGSLWSLSGTAGGQTGFSDRLRPGAISQLVQNSAIAFRAHFKNAVPAADRLYWRGMVLWLFDGESWRQGIATPEKTAPLAGGGEVSYTVTLEPHQKRWLFALDLPAAAPMIGRLKQDNTLIAKRRLMTRIRYPVTSYGNYATGPLAAWEAAALILPPEGNNRAKALARSWAASGKSPQEIVAAALGFLRSNGFGYTLNPPPLGSDRIDDFLFNTRRGYCEHFASAFTYLMRSAGIPARIVVGYLGGERNPYGDYLIVRQSDAHAWTEVWLSPQGWVRVDPTSVVAPARVQTGISAVLSAGEYSSWLASPYLQPVSRYVRHVILSWDAVNNYWNQHILGYSSLRQKRLLAKIGIKTVSWRGPAKVFIAAVGLLAAVTLLLTLLRFRSGAPPKDDVQRLYDRFTRKLARAGMPRRPQQGPLDYLQTVAQHRGDLEKPAAAVIRLYIKLRYEGGRDENLIREFRRKVKRFNPRTGSEHAAA